jgi:HK97 family phage prohead protease
VPYTILEGTAECAEFGVFKQYDGESELLACHKTKEDALAHLAALAIAKGDEEDASEDEKENADGVGADETREPYSVTDGMVEEAERGLAWREEFGRGGTEVGVARARDISNRKNLPYDTVQRMHSYFSRHEVDKQADGFSQGEEGYPSAGRIAWALWGGDAGQTWAADIVERVQADEDQEAAITPAPAMQEVVEQVASELKMNKKVAQQLASRALVRYATGSHKSVSKRQFVENHLRSYNYALLNERFKKGSHDTDLLPSSHPLSTSGLSYRGAMSNLTMERRSISLTSADVNVRADGDGVPLHFSGYAALFDSPSAPLPFTEKIAPNAFRDTLTRAANGEWQVKLLHGHDAGQMLAATGSGSLRLTEDERGLRVEADLIPSEIGKHVALLVDREASAMSMSFGFTVPKDGQVWNADRTERTLTKVHLFEVSILSGQDPAYPATAGLGEVRALAERAGVDATQLSLALSSLSFGNFLDDEDVAIIDAAVRTLAPKKRRSAPASVLKALAEAKSRSNR